MIDRIRALETKELLSSATIQALYYYPLKSGRRLRLDVAQLTRKGILHDRELMAVDADTNYMLSQRFDPKLALITTTFGENEFTMEAEGVHITATLLREGQMRGVTVHTTKNIRAVDQGDDAAGLVSQVIGHRARVVRMADDYVRTIKPEYISPDADISNEVGLADGAALLVTSEKSAAKVREWIEEDTPGYPFIPIDNYRGNVEVDSFGFEFGEDKVLLAQSGNTILYFGWLSSRCDETTTHQQTGEKNPKVGRYLGDPNKGFRQPLYSLTLRRMGEYAPGKRGALFGVNVQPKFRDDKPMLRVGEKINIIQTIERN